MLKFPIIANRYWNANGIGVAVAAVQGEINDWAAYIGAQPDPTSEEETTEWARRFGCKLSMPEAFALLPGSDKWLLTYRE